MKTSTGILRENLNQVAKRLSVTLADEFVLYVKTLRAHWNIEGRDFYNQHLFFEVQYRELMEIIDAVAERIRAIGHYAPASMSLFLQLTRLSETTEHYNDSGSIMKELLGDHDAIIMSLRSYTHDMASKLSDAGTDDFLTGLIEKHETMAWKLRSHL